MKKIAILSIIILSIFMACKKDTVDPIFTMVGMWEGKLGTGSEVPDSFLGLNLKSNGVLERINVSGNVSATGTWNLNGTSVTGNYTFTSGTIVNITAVLNKDQKKITGTWFNNGNEEGTWHVTKK